MKKFMKLPPPFIDGTDDINAIIETPKGSRNKYAYDHETEMFALKKALPAGMIFPFDFGFIPSTIAQDGDPMDILVLTDAPTFPGCIVKCKIIGIIKVKQEKKGQDVRNDRVIGVQLDSRLFSSVDTLKDLEDGMLKEIIHFFSSYNEISEDKFEPIGNHGTKEAIRLIHQCIRENNIKQNGHG
jgi:inorganic pyrophosphatase